MSGQTLQLVLAVIAAAALCHGAAPNVARGIVGAKKFANAHDCNAAVAFFGTGALTSTDGDNKLGFHTALTDKGIGWNRESGEFTCFCPGLYQLSFAGTGSADARLALKKRASTSDKWVTVVATGLGGGANSALVDMEIGDRAAVWLESGKLTDEIDDLPSASFSGFRIAKK